MRKSKEELEVVANHLLNIVKEKMFENFEVCISIGNAGVRHETESLPFTPDVGAIINLINEICNEWKDLDCFGYHCNIKMRYLGNKNLGYNPSIELKLDK